MGQTDGGWLRCYAYSDGSTEEASSLTGGFEQWEREHEALKY